MRVLLLEDEQAVIRGIARVLRREGHEVVECASCSAALDSTGHFDVAVLDVELLDGRGDEIGDLLMSERRVERVVFYTGLSGFAPTVGLVVEKPDLEGLKAAVRHCGR